MAGADQGPRSADGPRYFFQHIMKTAGTSFAQHIRATFADRELYPCPLDPVPVRRDQYWKIDEIRALTPDQLQPVRMFHGHFPFLVGDMVGADITLTILRDPVERTVSHIRHCRRHNSAHRGKALEEIYEDAWLQPLFFRNYQVKQFALTVDDAPKAHNEVLVIDEGRLATALENLERVDLLGLTSRYDEFLNGVVDRFGWTIGATNVLQTGPGSIKVSKWLRRRLEADHRSGLEFYERAVELYENRRGRARRTTQRLHREG